MRRKFMERSILHGGLGDFYTGDVDGKVWRLTVDFCDIRVRTEAYRYDAKDGARESGERMAFHYWEYDGDSRLDLLKALITC